MMVGIEKNMRHNNALDADPPVASFVKPMLVGGGPVNAIVMPFENTVDSNPYVAPQEEQNNVAGLEPRADRWFAKLRIVARCLWIAPLIIAIPTFFVAAESIPDMNRGSIGDGFRKLNVFLAVMGPLVSICWGLAFLLTICHDIRLIPKSRILVWLAVFTLLIALAITLAMLDR